MNTKLKNILITFSSALGAILLVTTATYAIGTLTPSGTAGDDTQYTLNDIYAKITANTNATIGDDETMTVPGGTPAASFRTLTEIYNALPEWRTLSDTTATVQAGYYEATNLATIDTDLVAANIADNVTIFGVMGTKEDGVVYPTQWSIEDPAGYVTWQAAMDYCDTLTENTHTDWRLPSYIELVNAYLTGVSGFQIDGYWSSTELQNIPSSAYYLNMSDGLAYSYDKTFPDLLARCTR